MPQIEPPEPKAQRLLEVIVKEIANGRIREGHPETFLAYSEALELLGEYVPWLRSGVRLSQLGLKDLHDWTEEHDELPKVTGLIVNKVDRRPHQDFAKWHGHEDDPNWETWWMEEADRAIRYDWSPYLQHLSERNAPAVALRVCEDEETYGYGGVIKAEPPPARIRRSGITVAEVLQWLAEGESESEVLARHPGLKREDIRASLIFAADREQREARAGTEPSRLSTLARQWQGTFTLPQADPSDPRMDHLLKKYWSHRA
jgi:uncharacterized protein (DUF433 family)